MFQPTTDRKIKLDNSSAVNPAEAKLDQDIIVHNMPNRARLSKTSYTRSNSSYDDNGFLDNGAAGATKSNFKKVGLVIIVLGIALIVALVYLGYRFFIKPQAEPTVTPLNNQPIVQTQTTSTDEFLEEDNDALENIEAAVIDSVNVEVVSPDVYSPETSETNTSTPIFSETENQEVAEEIEILPVLDFDSDGLTDDEENALNTSLEKADTDEDGYTDLGEIINGYDPLGPGSLAGSRFITRYQNTLGSYSVLYPATWDLKSLNNNFTIIISAPDNSLVQISTQDNSKIQNILSWYEETFPDEGNAYERLKQGQNWEGIMGEGGLNFYLTDSTRRNIYVISYIPIISGRLAYPNIFEMMINSFMIN